MIALLLKWTGGNMHNFSIIWASSSLFCATSEGWSANVNNLLCVPWFVIPGGCMWGCSYMGMCMYMCASGCQHSCQDLHNIIFPHMDSVAHCIFIYPHMLHGYQHHLVPRPMQKRSEKGWSPWQQLCKCWFSNLDFGWMNHIHLRALTSGSKDFHSAITNRYTLM